MNADELVAFLIPNAQRWIKSQRDMHRPHSFPLSTEDTVILQRYFRKDTLDRARFRRVHRIENPPFYGDLARAGISMPLDFRQMAGITFDNTILISDMYSTGQQRITLLFHEMVHVAQYAFLGVNAFAIQYVNGWAKNGFDYFAIPLEREAYELQGRFEATPSVPFSIEAILENKLRKI